MARLAGGVIPGVAHHVTQRGNRRQRVFFTDGDYAEYRALIAQSCSAAGVAIWDCCLMPNHVHLVLVPARTPPPHPPTLISSRVDQNRELGAADTPKPRAPVAKRVALGHKSSG
jgi:REP element-mobilizing transposase RayT